MTRNIFRRVRTSLAVSLLCAGAVMVMPATSMAATNTTPGFQTVTKVADASPDADPSLKAATCQVFLTSPSTGNVSCTATSQTVFTLYCTAGTYTAVVPTIGAYQFSFSCAPGIYVNLTWF